MKNTEKMLFKTSVSSVLFKIEMFLYFFLHLYLQRLFHKWWFSIQCTKWEMVFSCRWHWYAYTVQWKAIKAILIGFSLTGVNLFSGTFAMINYTANIFKASGSTLDPNISSIIIAVIQVLGVYGSTLLVDRIGRKTLLIFSTSGAFVGLTSLGIYSYLNDSGYDLTTYNWIPLISFSTFVFISCFGILPLPFIVLTEILPTEVKILMK